MSELVIQAIGFAGVAFFIGSPCVLVYDILIRSWGGVLSETITLASIIVSVIRFGWKNMGDPDSEFQG